jgi:hypothetical protein
MSRRNGETGAVTVLLALVLPVIVIFASFAIDTAHYWDFSRNLQNRVDAAMLAAGTAYGGTCFGTPDPAALANIGHLAQRYSGVPTGTPDVNLPYLYSAGTPYENQTNDPGADPNNFHLILNGSTHWKAGSGGGTSFQKGNFCAATYDNPADPAIDAWATQAKVPLFFHMFGFAPDISAHARVQLQGAGSTNSIPVAVPDPAQTPCLRAEVINDTTGQRINDSNGNPIDVAMTPPDLTATPPKTFWTVTLPQFTVPAAQLSVQAYIPDDCNNPGYPGNGVLYDSQLDANGNQVASHGIEFINTYTPLPPTLSGNNAAIGSVYLAPNKNCDDPTEAANQDPYFYYFPNSTTNGCSVTVCADIKFGSGLSNPNAFVNGSGAQNQMKNPGANGDPCMVTLGTVDPNAYWLSEPVASESGRNTFTITWKAGGNNGTFGLQQATYAAFSDGSSPADDSGPITQAFIGNTGGAKDVNSLQQGSTQTTLTVSFLLQGLALSRPNDPPIILRTAVNNRKATGDFDCGQGTGAQGLHDAIVNGCPDPVAIYNSTQGCVFLPATPLTCANLVPGSKRGQADQAWQDRVESAKLNGTPSACDMWQSYKPPPVGTSTAISGFEPWGNSVPDSRIIVMAVTAPADLSGGGGPTNSVKILGFATFYITGFDNDPWLPKKNGNGGSKIPNCSAPTDADEPYPGTGTPGQGEIWGHFIKYVAPGASNGQPCDPNSVSPCVPALTR